MGDICGMSSLPISPEQLTALPPDVCAVIVPIVRHAEERIARLEAELQCLRKTPQNSSLPPSTQHPHAKPGNRGQSRTRNGAVNRDMRSAHGSRFVEKLLTTIETCRQQQRNVFEFVTQTVNAHFYGQPTPSLFTEL